MSLAKEFEERVNAGVSGILIRTVEPEAALVEIQAVCRRNDLRWSLAQCDVVSGVWTDFFDDQVQGWYSAQRYWAEDRYIGMASRFDPSRDYSMLQDAKGITPLQIVTGLGGLHTLQQVEKPDSPNDWTSVLVIKNPGTWLKIPQFVQLLANRLYENRNKGLFVVLLSTSASLPPELEHLFEAGHIRHALPDREQIEAIAVAVAGDDFPPPEDRESREAIIDAAAGLSRTGVEDAIALSLVRDRGGVNAKTVFELKAEYFASNSSAIEIYRGEGTFADYGGAAFLKQFCLDLLKERSDDPLLRPRGVFLLGMPGVGKSYLARCLGNEVRRPTLSITLGAMKSRWQGASFENLLSTLETVEACQPAICFFDEVEGQLSGGKDTGSMDAGTTSQINSKLLSWLSDKTADVFAMCAANDVKALMRDMPEFVRMGRFDGLFFLDYPDKKSKEEIWKIHLLRYKFPELDAAEDLDAWFKDFSRKHLPPDDFWTGSEIEACCRLARLRKKSVLEIGETMPTVSSQAKEKIAEIREWAEGRCYAAEYDGIYQRETHEKRLLESARNGASRRVLRSSKSSLN